MAGEIVTSCPLCLALSDPVDMVDIEIDRVVPKGRAHVLLCRSCGSSLVRAMAAAGEPLAQELIDADAKAAKAAIDEDLKIVNAVTDAQMRPAEHMGEKEEPMKPQEPDDGEVPRD